MTLPGYVVDFRGHPACPCLAAWLPVYEAELQRRGSLVGPLRIYQLIGTAPASAGVHRDGGAFDITDLVGDIDVEVARQMGADASWARTAAQGFTPHIHGVLTGCPHNGPARYQIDAVRADYNGLGHLGHGGRDDGPRPLSGRTWREGIEWAEEQDMTPKQAAQLDGLTKAVAGLADMVEALAENDEAIKRRVTKAKREMLAALEGQETP